MYKDVIRYISIQNLKSHTEKVYMRLMIFFIFPDVINIHTKGLKISEITAAKTELETKINAVKSGLISLQGAFCIKTLFDISQYRT